jgi:ubiquinone/menaquinone biosynthesis C-methylase UbiE
MTETSYLLAGQASELGRLQLQSRVWEPAGRRLLDQIGDGAGSSVCDIGCGAMGWLRLLSEWVGPDGKVVGTDIDEAMLSAADRFVSTEGLSNVALIKDDLFATDLEPGSFDLVHARFQLALGRSPEQMASYLRLVRPGGTVALEDVDPPSWHFIGPAPAHDRLIGLIRDAFHGAGIGDPSATQLQMFRDAGIEVEARAEVQPLPPGHPYQRLALQFAKGLRRPLQAMVGEEELSRLEQDAERELEEPDLWGVTFTLFQTWGRRPA